MRLSSKIYSSGSTVFRSPRAPCTAPDRQNFGSRIYKTHQTSPYTPWDPLKVPFDPFDPLDAPLWPLNNPVHLLEPSSSPVLPYNLSEDLSNVVVDPMGPQDRHPPWPLKYPGRPLTRPSSPKTRQDYKETSHSTLFAQFILGLVSSIPTARFILWTFLGKIGLVSPLSTVCSPSSFFSSESFTAVSAVYWIKSNIGI